MARPATPRDPYDVLGVSKEADLEEIRNSYRKLAKRYHPDLNPGNKEAEARFKEIASAYDLLSDKDKRARFDRGELDESGAERPPPSQSWRGFAEVRDKPGHFLTQPVEAGTAPITALIHVDSPVDLDLQRMAIAARTAMQLRGVAARIGDIARNAEALAFECIFGRANQKRRG